MCALQARLVIGGEPSTPALVEALLLQCGNARCALTTQAVNNRHTAQLSIYTSFCIHHALRCAEKRRDALLLLFLRRLADGSWHSCCRRHSGCGC